MSADTQVVQKLKRKDIKRLEGDALLRAEQELVKARDTFKASRSQYEETKLNIVRGLAEELAGILPSDQHHKIASKIKSYFAKAAKDGDLELISKATIYRALDGKFKDESRSESISEGRNEGKSHERHTTDADDSQEYGAVPSGPLGSRNPDRTITQDRLIDIVNEVIQSAVEEGDSYRVPKDVFEKLVMAAPRAA